VKWPEKRQIYSVLSRSKTFNPRTGFATSSILSVLVSFLNYKGGFTHTMPFPCCSPATTLPFSESALFHTGHCIWYWYASDNKLPVARNGKSLTCRHPAAATLPRTCHEPAMALRARFQKGIFVAWQGNGMACVNQTRPHCVNQMGNTQSKALVERHGMCESALREYTITGNTTMCWF
jgi:hypothetical protein